MGTGGARVHLCKGDRLKRKKEWEREVVMSQFMAIQRKGPAEGRMVWTPLSQEQEAKF